MSIQLENPNHRINDMQQLARSVNRVLAIQNFGSSGSKLFHALVDDHPNIIAIPTLYMIDFFAVFWPEDVECDQEEVINEFCKTHAYWFDPKGYVPWGTHTMGHNRDESVYVDKDIFIKNLKDVLGSNASIKRKLFFQSLFIAYAMSYGRNLELNGNQYTFIYPYHSGCRVEAVELTKDFPDTQFLYCLREPIQTLGSSFKIFVSRFSGFPAVSFFRRYTTAAHLFSVFLRDTYLINPVPYRFYGYMPILENYRSKSIGFRLEDLVKTPKEILLKFCKWSNIPWDDALLSATYNGKVWWNRPESARVTGFSDKPLSRKHKDVLSEFDKQRLEIVFSDYKKKMGYPYVSSEKSAFKKFVFKLQLLVPFKVEYICIFPNKISFPQTFEFFKDFSQRLNMMTKNKSVRGTKISMVAKEFRWFALAWLMLVPLRSYIRIRWMLFQSLENLSGDIDMVDFLTI